MLYYFATNYSTDIPQKFSHISKLVPLRIFVATTILRFSAKVLPFINLLKSFLKILAYRL